MATRRSATAVTVDVAPAAGLIALLAGLLMVRRQSSELKTRYLHDAKDREARLGLLEAGLSALRAESAERQAVIDQRLGELRDEMRATETRAMEDLQKLQCGLDERLGSFVAGYDELVRVEIAA